MKQVIIFYNLNKLLYKVDTVWRESERMTGEIMASKLTTN